MIEVILTFVDYKDSMENGYFPIDVIMEVEYDDYPDGIQLGDWKDNGILKFKTHLQAKVEHELKNVDIALKMGSDEADRIESIYFTADKEQRNLTNIFQKCVGFGDEDEIYYIPQAFWKQDRQGKKQRIDKPNHYTSSGISFLWILFKNGTRQCMEFSSISNAFHEETIYQKLLQDIAEIHQTLVMNTAGSMSMSKGNFDKIYEEIAQKVDALNVLLYQIEKSPEYDLVSEVERIPFRKVKHITGRNIAEWTIKKQGKVNGIVHRESLNIYEHRMIKRYLQLLLKVITYRKELERNLLEKQINGIKTSVQNNFFYDETEYKNRKKIYDDAVAIWNQRKKDFDEAMDAIDKPLFQKMEQYKYVKVSFSVTDVLKPKYKDKKYILESKKFDNNTRMWTPIDRNGGVVEIESEQKEYNGRKLSIIVDTQNIFSTAFYYYYLLGEGKEYNARITICGYADIEYKVERGYYTYIFCFKQIKELTIGTKRDFQTFFADKILLKKAVASLAEEMEVEILCEYMNKFPEFDDEKLKMIESKIRKNNRLQIVERRKQYCEEKWRKLEHKTKQMFNNPILKLAEDSRELLTSTNLFQQHKWYSAVYQIMIQKKELFEGIEWYGTSCFTVRKLEQLYEYWCCIKLLSIFIQDYSFTFLSAQTKGKGTWQDLKTYITDVLKEGTFSDTKFLLHSDALNLHITMWYEHDVKLDNAYLNNQRLLPIKKQKKKYLCPDIILTIQNSNSKKTFCFDAKYRSSLDSFIWYKDLCEVALQKYMLELGSGNRQESNPHEMEFTDIRGSFILHSNLNLKEELLESETEGYPLYCNPKGYYGVRPRVIVNKYKKLYSKRNHVFTEKAYEWTRYVRDVSNHENQIGSVAVLPENDMYLKNLIRMIMEREFHIYQKMCFMCGTTAEQLKIEKRKTKSDYDKWLISCSNCDEIWVQTHCGETSCPTQSMGNILGKHSLNYYEQYTPSKKDIWNVRCPVCYNLAPETQEMQWWQVEEYYMPNV